MPSAVVVSWPVTSTPTEPISPRALSSLSPALRAVHALLLRGFSDDRIADIRGTSRNVVTKQVNTIFKKLGVHSRRELSARSS